MRAPKRPLTSLVTMALKMARTTSGAAKRGQSPEDQFGQELKVGRAITPEKPNGNCDRDGEYDPNIEGKPSRPALGFILRNESRERHPGRKGYSRARSSRTPV